MSFGQWRRLIPLCLAGMRYMTVRKLFNFIRCEMECFWRMEKLESRPYSAIIEPTNICNLQCPYCPTGAGRDSGRKKTMIDVSLVESFIEQNAPYLISVNFYNWGEPLLHPKIHEIVRICHDHKVFMSLSTNLNIRNLDILDKVCRAGLDHMVVSCSGATQDVYEIYHRDAKMDTLLAGLKYLKEYKKRNQAKVPIVELHYILFKHNLHQLDAASDLAREYGVTAFRVMDGTGPEEAAIGKRDDPKYILADVNHCHQLWHLVVLNADGGITPCYYLYYKTDDFGDFSVSDMSQLRNDRSYLMARQLFSPKSAGNLPPDLSHPCLKCEKVHNQKHLLEYLKKNENATQAHRTGGP